MIDAPTYRFAGFAFDASSGLLRSGAREIALRPKSVVLLCLLIRNAGRVISKDELLSSVWTDVIVTEDSLTQCISDIRRALGDADQKLIRTVPRRGYLFSDEGLDADTRSALLRISPVPFGKPSIAVLPFENLSGDESQGFVADGTAEEIVAALAQVEGLTVIARNFCTVFRGQSLDLPQIGRELGVRYLLEGSLRRQRERVRISTTLIEAATASLLWAESFEGDAADMFTLQDYVSAGVVGAMLPLIERDGIGRPRSIGAGEAA